MKEYTDLDKWLPSPSDDDLWIALQKKKRNAKKTTERIYNLAEIFEVTPAKVRGIIEMWEK